jgi:hypothetical protein
MQPFMDASARLPCNSDKKLMSIFIISIKNTIYKNKSLLALLILLILSNSSYASGPVINGFYLGMSKQGAIDNANKLGLIIDIKSITDIGSSKLFFKEECNKPGLYGLIVFSNNVVSLISFNPKVAFNWQAMAFEKFIYEFCTNYKIPIDKMIRLSPEHDFYRYDNYDEGYLLVLSPIDVGVSILQKPSELQFK